MSNKSSTNGDCTYYISGKHHFYWEEPLRASICRCGKFYKEYQREQALISINISRNGD